jgi:hypothetical protein
MPVTYSSLKVTIGKVVVVRLKVFVAERNDTGERIKSLSDSSVILRQLAKAHLLICPECKAILFFRNSTQRRAHFYHSKNSSCSYSYSEPETREHENGKVVLMERLKELYPNAEVEIEYRIAETKQRSDVIVLHPDGSRWAFEMQCSGITGASWHNRHRLYSDAGVIDFWVLGYDNFEPKKNYLSAIEKKLYYLNKLCYLNPSEGILRLVSGNQALGSISIPFKCSSGYLSCATIEDGHWHMDTQQIIGNENKTYYNSPRDDSSIYSFLGWANLPGAEDFLSDEDILKYYQIIEKDCDILNNQLFRKACKFLGIKSLENVPPFLKNKNECYDGIAFMCNTKIWRTYLFCTLVRHYSGKQVNMQKFLTWILNDCELPLNRELEPKVLEAVVYRLVLIFLSDLYSEGFIIKPSRESFDVIKNALSTFTNKLNPIRSYQNNEIKSARPKESLPLRRYQDNADIDISSVMRKEPQSCNACGKLVGDSDMVYYDSEGCVCRECANKGVSLWGEPKAYSSVKRSIRTTNN